MQRLTDRGPHLNSRRRFTRLVLVALMLGATLAIVPQPAFAVEQGTRLDTVTPELTAWPPGTDAADTEAGDTEAGDTEAGDTEAGDTEAGDTEIGDTEAAAPTASSRLRAEAAGVEEFELIGVAFEAAVTEDARIRVHVDGTWSDWEPLTNIDGEHGPDEGSAEAARAQPASDPIWVGAGDGYELDLPGDATAVKVHLVRETEQRVLVDATPEAEAYEMPSVRTRSSWGARGPKDPTEFADTVDLAVVHHTVNANGYSSASVPAMLRSIQTYHMDGNGWSDIGYNFVVDRFGRTWEGRAQSTYKATIGAHAKDSNTGSTGIAFLGEGTSTPLPSATREAISKLIAWKLPLHGSFFSGSAIVGHRDVFSTSCPGNAVYNQLGSIRSRAGALRPPPGPFLDVAHTAWNGDEVAWGKDAGVATGYQDGNFLPAETLSRAQLVNMLWSMVGLPAATAPHGFTDVPRSSWLTPALDWAKENGVITGYEDGSFRGDNTVRRDSIAVLLWRWATGPVATTAHGFSDIADGSWADDALDWAKSTEVVDGYDDGTYRPSRAVTRGQVLPMLYEVRPFTDVAGTAWYADGAHWGFHQQIALGFADRTFRHTNAVNRAQGTSMLWRLMDAPTTPTPAAHGWPDVAPGSWYESALDWGTEAGWVDGHDDGGFHGDDPLLRHEVVLWIWRTAGSPAATTIHPFTDVPDGAPYEAALDWAHEHGVATGFGDEFRPEDGVNRAQWITMLHRLASTAAAWVGGATPPTTTLF